MHPPPGRQGSRGRRCASSNIRCAVNQMSPPPITVREKPGRPRGGAFMGRRSKPRPVFPLDQPVHGPAVAPLAQLGGHATRDGGLRITPQAAGAPPAGATRAGISGADVGAGKSPPGKKRARARSLPPGVNGASETNSSRTCSALAALLISSGVAPGGDRPIPVRGSACRACGQCS
jgi:hypothetical protein